MTTLAEHIIVVGAENRPLMLEKSIYDSWTSRIRLFIKGKKHGRMMLDSIDNGPLVYPTIKEDGQTRPKKYFELTEAQQLQDDCDVQATNIILHCLPLDVYALINHLKEAKDIWYRVKLLMKDTDLSYQGRECRLYNLFDKFAYVQGETLYEYYWRFSQLINEMHTIGMTMQQVQGNTKFSNALPSDWSKFVTDVKLAKSLYTTNYDQLYAYLSQHERHANEVRSSMYPPPQQFTPVYATPIHHQHHHTPVNSQKQSGSPQPFISSLVTQQSQAEFSQLDSRLAVPTFQQGEDLIDCINKEMAFLYAVASRGIATTSRGNYAAGQAKVMKCYNCLGKGIWRNNALSQRGQEVLHGLRRTFQTKDLDAYDSNCDDISSAKAVMMANLSSCDSDVLSEVPNYDTYLNDMINQDVQEMSYSEQTHIVDFPDNEITSDSNIIPYPQYPQESQNADIQDTNSSAPNDLLVLYLVEQITDNVANLDKENQTNKMINESIIAELERYKGRVTIFEQRLNVDLNKREKLIDSQMDDLIRNRNAKFTAFQQEIDTLKETLSNQSLENLDLNAQLQEKVLAITSLKNELRKLKGKNVVNTVVSKPNGTIAPGMFKLDIEPISPRLKNNRDAHEVYIEKTIEYTDTLRGFVERARTQYPSEPLLESACMFTKHVQELLVYVSQTCPNSPKPCEKLVAVTPINKDKRVIFAEPVKSLNNIPKQTDSLKTKYSNKHLFTSTGVKPTTSASRSKPLGNTKNNRITRPPRSYQKNKVEDHLRKVKSSLNKTNSISEPIRNALLSSPVRNANLNIICAICNKCLFYDKPDKEGMHEGE
ncbi:hypothetical protein Tco_0499685 [Tanacetum coccineum]